jgi:hypothetical protein
LFAKELQAGKKLWGFALSGASKLQQHLTKQETLRDGQQEAQQAMRFCMPDSRISRQEYASLTYFFLILNVALEKFCPYYLVNN